MNWKPLNLTCLPYGRLNHVNFDNNTTKTRRPAEGEWVCVSLLPERLLLSQEMTVLHSQHINAVCVTEKN